jgi:hypothetical protein
VLLLAVCGQKVARVGQEPPRVRHSWAPERAEGGVEGVEMPMTCRAGRGGARGRSMRADDELELCHKDTLSNDQNIGYSSTTWLV